MFGGWTPLRVRALVSLLTYSYRSFEFGGFEVFIFVLIFFGDRAVFQISQVGILGLLGVSALLHLILLVSLRGLDPILALAPSSVEGGACYRRTNCLV